MRLARTDGLFYSNLPKAALLEGIQCRRSQGIADSPKLNASLSFFIYPDHRYTPPNQHTQNKGRHMTAITFDTHKFIRKLESVGFSPQQAEAQADALIEALAATSSEMAAREYFDYRLKAELSELKVNLLKWITGALIAQAALIATLVKLL